ncbi:hypothetical protein RJT34_16513 [Clitoria ternatea]|uniref:Zinc-finger domain-containing protein n=1 Tax=Clitoria ternatea TaxID=43366 RepID=A0AAN9J8T1_CLITE
MFFHCIPLLSAIALISRIAPPLIGLAGLLHHFVCTQLLVLCLQIKCARSTFALGVLLQIRYGQRVEEVELLANWICPKCKGNYNCGICWKERGEQPTGKLAHEEEDVPKVDKVVFLFYYFNMIMIPCLKLLVYVSGFLKTLDLLLVREIL